ncbi:hypothetical protein [Massilia sp. CCM 8734]|uniref:hypothetical protein n=1 Tax=Massilia sp. CCM 8734 TaxID=2609283 RepID=UPI0014229886|nr:hypothetical protein [Massilia sp. CCM 8734]NHZ97837.1 hypothetical protein [Massilia sp. CCM 8734]
MDVDEILKRRTYSGDPGSAIAGQYDREVRPYLSTLDTSNVVALSLHFRAAMLAFFYSHENRYADTMERCLAILHSQGLAKKTHYDDMYATYITQRKFVKANEFVKKHNMMVEEEIPKVIDVEQVNAKPKIWYIDVRTRSLVADSFTWRSGLTVVVLSSPRCHFSFDFFAAMQNNSKLSALFQRHGVFLVPPGGELSFDALVQWNQRNPGYPVILADKRTDWPEIGLWHTPVFYFFLDGKVVEAVIGWPKEGSERALESIFERLIKQQAIIGSNGINEN